MSLVPAALAATGIAAGLFLFARRQIRRSRLRRKVVLVTGGSRGLGLELARQLGARGARVAICGRDPVALARAEDDLRARGVEVLARVCDVTDPDQVRRLLRDVRGHLGPVDVLVNNAGRIDVGPMEHLTDDDWQGSLDVHFWGPHRLIEAVLPDMKSKRRGHIVNVASFAGVAPVPHMAAYVASKHALVGMSRAYRLELGGHGITVTTVLPGLLRTGSHAHARYKGRNQAEYGWFTAGMATPGLSRSAGAAARAIRRAIERRDTEVVVGATARAGIRAQALLPRWTGRVLAWVDGRLPRPGGIGARSASGAESESRLTRGRWMRPLRAAEQRFNQIPSSRVEVSPHLG